MDNSERLNLQKFKFRGIHPQILIGRASDRYAGWIGQIYSEGRYIQGITHRTHKVGERSFVEEVLPVESVEEYFEHFPILEIDYTFYRPLLDKGGKPTPNYFTPKIIMEGIRCRKRINLITNNRAGGNAPLIAQQIAKKLREVVNL
ncbi:MAG: hypothetical protein ABSB22_23945 [Thermodesulfobacteriota bacterium]